MSRLYPGWGSGKTKYQAIYRAYSVACRDHEELARSSHDAACFFTVAARVCPGGVRRSHPRPPRALPHALQIYKALIGLNGFGSLDLYWFGTSAMTMTFTLIALLWIVVAGSINIRYYANAGQQGYFMQHVSGVGMLLLWLGFLLTLTRLAANSFSPFLYFQF